MSADLSFLDAQRDIFIQNDESWAREERRLFGGQAVLEELAQWTNESDPHYQIRKREAPYLNFGDTHASILSGHIVRQMPVPNWGTLGAVRERKQITKPTPAELMQYNCNGVGNDGAQLPQWVAEQIKRSCGVGSVWSLVEMPPPPPGRSPDAPLTEADILAGHRPYFVPFSRRAVPFWWYTRGQLDWAVARVPVRAPRVGAAAWTNPDKRNGYYLFVREGYTELGDEWARGGWWMYDPDKTLAQDDLGNPLTGTWARTRGQIPLVMLKAAESDGTQDWPADSRSLTMELGQIAVSLMNRISERNFDAADAAKSYKMLLGAEKDAHNLVVEQLKQLSEIVTVMGALNPAGGYTVPSVYDSSSGAIPSEVYATIITSSIAEAHEIMVRQLTSTPDSSGRSKEVGFGEATSPLLSTLAANTESWLNALIYFTELRIGAPSPRGFVTLPREYELAPVEEKIDRNLERMAKIGARSVILESRMIEVAASDDGLMPTEEADIKLVREQLIASLAAARPEQSASVQQLTASGGTLEGAAKLVGIGDDAIQLLVGGPVNGSPDQQLPEAGAVVSGDGGGNGALIQPIDTTPNAPTPPDTTAQEIAALREEIAAQRRELPGQMRDALIAALSQFRDSMQPPAQPPQPAPTVIFPPERPSVGKSVAVVTPEGKRWAVTVTPQDDTQASSPPNA